MSDAALPALWRYPERADQERPALDASASPIESSAASDLAAATHGVPGKFKNL